MQKQIVNGPHRHFRWRKFRELVVEESRRVKAIAVTRRSSASASSTLIGRRLGRQNDREGGHTGNTIENPYLGEEKEEVEEDFLYLSDQRI